MIMRCLSVIVLSHRSPITVDDARFIAPRPVIDDDPEPSGSAERALHPYVIRLKKKGEGFERGFRRQNCRRIMYSSPMMMAIITNASHHRLPSDASCVPYISTSRDDGSVPTTSGVDCASYPSAVTFTR